MAAQRFNYDEGLSDNGKKMFREKTVRVNQDKLYYDEREGKKWDLQFGSSLVEDWLKVMRKKYPNLQEIKQDGQIRLKSKEGDGTISLYPYVRVLVRGQIMETFERDFQEMRQEVQDGALTARMGGMTLTNDGGRPDEPVGEGASAHPSKTPTPAPR